MCSAIRETLKTSLLFAPYTDQKSVLKDPA